MSENDEPQIPQSDIVANAGDAPQEQEAGGPEADKALDELRAELQQATDRLAEAEMAQHDLTGEVADLKGKLEAAEAELRKVKAAKLLKGIPIDVQKGLRLYATPTRRSNPRTAQGLCLKYEIPKTFDN